MADETPNLTHEILKQIRDEMRGVRQELGHTNERLDGVRAELKETNRRLTSLEGETIRVGDAVTRHGRIVDRNLEVSLEDSGSSTRSHRKVRTLEAELKALPDGQ